MTGPSTFWRRARWFRANELKGPWNYATPTLPADFMKIPSGHPRAHVLASVPGTREAEDALLLAAIPRTAEINRKAAHAEVQYVGAPQFTPIPNTSVSYARNTPNDVLRIGDHYYLCLQGVWFFSGSPQGPWQAADRVPPEIYSIPESSPKYNVTYVRIYNTTPDTIVYGYTPGYYGAFVAGGAVVWGTGYYYPPYVAVGVATVPVYWGASCYTYGASAWYNPATGGYSRGSAVYGPYGGYGAASAYNPRTGTLFTGSGCLGTGRRRRSRPHVQSIDWHLLGRVRCLQSLWRLGTRRSREWEQLGERRVSVDQPRNNRRRADVQGRSRSRGRRRGRQLGIRRQKW